MAIRTMLDISTGHLPARFFGVAEDGHSDPDLQETAWEHIGGAYPTEHGLLLWVPDDPTDPNNTMHGSPEAVPPEVVAVWRYAREQGCDFVNFDSDGDRLADLPFWEW